jgi:CTP synthase (UTP-ammonia lyase)
VDQHEAGAPWIAVIGDRVEGFAPQDAIPVAVDHAAAAVDLASPRIRWIATDELERDGVQTLAGAAARWCAPGSPYRSLDGALAGIRWARETGTPFLGTCAGFQHGALLCIAAGRRSSPTVA